MNNEKYAADQCLLHTEKSYDIIENVANDNLLDDFQKADILRNIAYCWLSFLVKNNEDGLEIDHFLDEFKKAFNIKNSH